LEDAEKYFEKADYGKGTLDSGVAFSEEKGVFVANVWVRNVGKPKKPIKEFCDNWIFSISMWFAGMGGNYVENTFLGPFILGSQEDPKILEVANLLRNNFVVLVGVNSAYVEGKAKSLTNLYTFGAYRYTKEKKVHYFKRASSFEYKK